MKTVSMLDFAPKIYIVDLQQRCSQMLSKCTELVENTRYSLTEQNKYSEDEMQQYFTQQNQ